MALATGVKIVAVPTVRVLAENAPAEAQHVVIVLDAKRDQIFTARFERDVAIELDRARAGASRFAGSDARTIAAAGASAGGGDSVSREVHSEGDPDVIVTPAELWRPRARCGAARKRMAQRGEFADPDQLTPIYIRRPEAEEKCGCACTGRKRIELNRVIASRTRQRVPQPITPQMMPAMAIPFPPPSAPLLVTWL